MPPNVSVPRLGFFGASGEGAGVGDAAALAGFAAGPFLATATAGAGDGEGA
jgi:hypothetical protein